MASNFSLKVVGRSANIEVEQELKDLAQFVLGRFNAVHVLVNNAGRPSPEDGAYSKPESILPALDTQYNISVRSPYLLVHHLLPSLMENKGAVINVSGTSGTKVINPLMSAYAAMKAAVVRMTKYMALDFGPKGVRVNSISYGPVATAYVDELLGKEKAKHLFEKVADTAPLAGGRIDAKDAANLIVFLCSDAASRITGEDIVMDAGINLQPTAI